MWYLGSSQAVSIEMNDSVWATSKEAMTLMKVRLQDESIAFAKRRRAVEEVQIETACSVETLVVVLKSFAGVQGGSNVLR